MFTDAYGSTSHGLASVVQRIDFGPRHIRPEGIVSGNDEMWRLGSLRSEMLSLISERFRHVFGTCGLWERAHPDTLQLLQIGPNQGLANHMNRRERWQEGIASVAWSELPCESDLKGDAWSLIMERGSKKEQEKMTVEMRAGSAFVLTGAAQGATRQCSKGTTGHSRCGCCWSHGVRVNKDTFGARQSMTMRVLADSDEESGDEDDDSGAGEDAAQDDADD